MISQGTALHEGNAATDRRISGWWATRVAVLVAVGVVAAGHLLDGGGWSSYSSGVGVGAGLTVIATLFVLINGPEPRWATRWAWFWLIMNPALMITLPLFLIGSGPLRTSDKPVTPTGERLAGGWAFLIAVLVLGSVRVRF